MERLKRGEPMTRVDITRYKVEAPPPSKKNDPEAWNTAVKNAQAQLEHQYLRWVFFFYITKTAHMERNDNDEFALGC